MTILAIDTSAAVCAALVSTDGTEIASRIIREQRRHAEQLAPLIADLLTQSNLAPAEITAVAVGTGPAPFTGLRVGLVTAQTFALGVGIPTYGVPSLDALGVQAAAQLALTAGTKILVVADARRKEVYYARYEVTGQESFGVPVLREITEPGVATAAQVVADGHCEGARVVGPGVTLYPTEFAGRGIEGGYVVGQSELPSDSLDVVQPVFLARLALSRATAGTQQPTTPLYLRRPDAQVPAARKRALP